MDNVKNIIESLIPSDFVVIDYNDFSQSGKIKLIIDSYKGVDLKSTSTLARKIKKSDIINNIYPNGLQLEISSPGIDADLKYPFQFSKNIGQNPTLLEAVEKTNSKQIKNLISLMEKILISLTI